jgi:hypothetical protein
MTVTTTKTRHSSQIDRASFADDLGRLQIQSSLQTLQHKKEASSQRKEPSSTPTQEKWGVELLLEWPATTK